MSVIKLSVMLKIEEQGVYHPSPYFLSSFYPPSNLKIPYNYFLIKVNSVLPTPSISVSPSSERFFGSPLPPPYPFPPPPPLHAFVLDSASVEILSTCKEPTIVVARRVTTLKRSLPKKTVSSIDTHTVFAVCGFRLTDRIPTKA